MTNSTTSVLVSTVHPFPTISLALPSATPLASLPRLFSHILPVKSQSLSTRSGCSLSFRSDGNLGSIGGSAGFVELRLVPRVLGGKGGFGSQLRAAGGRMSSHKATSNDACRDLNGRRLSTIKEAKKLAASIASEPERQAAARKAAEERLEALNAEVARLEAAINGEGSSAGTKRRLDDAEDLEKARESNEKLRGAVASAMLKKRKKNKTSPPAAAADKGKAKALEESTTASAIAV